MYLSNYNMKIKRTVSVAGECFTLPFTTQKYWVVDSVEQKVAEVATVKVAKWLARVLNEHFHMADELDSPQETL